MNKEMLKFIAKPVAIVWAISITFAAFIFVAINHPAIVLIGVLIGLPTAIGVGIGLDNYYMSKRFK